MKKTKASLVIFINDGKILLLKKANENLWVLPGGKYEPGETEEQTAERELQEELGFSKSFERFLSCNVNGKDITLFFSYEKVDDIKLSTEHTAFGWFDITNIDLSLVGPMTKDLFKFLYMQKAKPLNEALPPSEEGLFGAKRKFDIHTGMDFYAQKGDPVFAIHSGEVISIDDFTGELSRPPTPYWNNTKSVTIRTECGFFTHDILYGELEPSVYIGQRISSAQEIGRLLTVLKKDKGKPMTMLHLELYKDFVQPVSWELNNLKPSNLYNPSILVIK